MSILRYFNYHRLQPGDIACIEDGTVGDLAYHIFAPPTRISHVAIVTGSLRRLGDYEIAESIPNGGVRIGRLSWYRDRHYKIYRLNAPEARSIGYQAVALKSIYGRTGYDFQLYLLLAVDLPLTLLKILWQEHRLRRIRPAELHILRNRALVCTEFVNELYRLCRRPLIPDGAPALPAGYQAAINDGKLRLVHVHWPNHKRRWLPRRSLVKAPAYRR
jgi:hypothetical protein